MNTRPQVVFINLGGNDISDVCDISAIFTDICKIVSRFYASGAKHVYVSKILTRKRFTRDRQMTSKRFDNCRKKLNKLLENRYPGDVITFHAFKPHLHMLDDGVHLNNDGQRIFLDRISEVVTSGVAHTAVAHALSKVLRHTARQRGLHMADDGFVTLCELRRLPEFVNLTADWLVRFSVHDVKGRFELA